MALLGSLKGWYGSTVQGRYAGVWAQDYTANERVRRHTPSQIFPTFRKALHE